MLKRRNQKKHKYMKLWMHFLLGCFSVVLMSLSNGLVVRGETLTRGDYTFIVLSDGTIEITDYDGDDKIVKVPDTIEGKTVTSISGAFSGCRKLEEIILPNTLTTIKSGSFQYCVSLKNIALPNGVTQIPDGVFTQCESLHELNISEYVTYIGRGAFWGCSNLESIVVATNNKVYDSRNDCNAIIKTDTNELLLGCQASIIPTGVESIGANAFIYCDKLKTIDIPDTVTSMDEHAFEYCSNLSEIIIPKNVTSISDSTFFGCSNLDVIIVDENNEKYDSRNECNAIIESDSNRLIVGSKTTIIPNGITCIGENAFSCRNISNTMKIPDGVECIEEFAFGNCEKMTGIIIPETVTNIKRCAFVNCGLTEINIPDGVKYIDYEAFNRCANLEKVTISKTVISIGTPFIDCSSLKYIVVNEENKVYDSRNDCNALIETETNTIIAGTSLSTFPETVENIGMSAFSGRNGLKELIIPGSIKKIESGAFSNCDDLVKVKLMEGVTVVGASAFYDCNHLKKVSIPEGIDCIKSYTFYRDSELKKINIPKSVTLIETDAFMSYKGNIAFTVHRNSYGEEYVKDNNCVYVYSDIDEDTDFTFIENEEGNLTIVGYAGTESQIIIPEMIGGRKVTAIGENAFLFLKDVEYIEIPVSVDMIATNSFSSYDYSLKVKSNSYAEQYAKKYGFKIVGEDENTEGQSGQTTEETDDKKTEKPSGDSNAQETNKVSGTDMSISHDNTNKDTSAGDYNGNKEELKKGTKVIVSKTVYQILDTKKRTVSYVKSQKKREAHVKIGSTVKIQGKNYKIIQIANSAFKNNKKIKSVTIGENIETIGISAFKGCSNLSEVTFKGTRIKVIGKHAFKGVRKTVKWKMKDSVRTKYQKIINKAK